MTNPPPELSTGAGASAPPAWSPRAWRLAMAVIVVGALLRLVLALCGRPLWHDEAMLAANLVQRDFEGLRQPLDYGQVAPIGYLYVQRLLLNTLGTSDLTLRWMSLAPGLLALPMFLVILRRLLTPKAAILALLLFSLSEPLVYYSMEAKPYSVDVLCGLLFFWLALRVWQDGGRILDVAMMAIAGAGGLLFSYVLVFLIVSTGGLIIALQVSKKQVKQAAMSAAACALCAVVFLYLKSQFMQDSPAVQHHKGFWRAIDPRGFMPLPPRNFDDLLWYLNRPFDFFVDPMRYRAYGVAILVCLAGIAMLWRSSRFLVLLLLAPIPMIALISATEMYPFGTQAELRHPIIGRVLLPFVPLVLIVMGRGLQAVWDAGGRYGKFVVAGLLVILWTHPTLMLLSYVRHRDEPHDARPAMALLSKHVQPGDLIYVNYSALMLSHYYIDRYPLKDAIRFTVSNSDTPLKETIAPGKYWIGVKYPDLERTFKLAKGRRVWVFFVHAPDLVEHKSDDKFLRWYLPTVARRLPIPDTLDPQTGQPAEYWSKGNTTLQLYDMRP